MNYIYDPIPHVIIEPAELDNEGHQTKAAVLDHRYHVNTLVGCCPEIPPEYVVDPAPNVSRCFAGVPLKEHVFLRFPDKTTAESYFGVGEECVAD